MDVCSVDWWLRIRHNFYRATLRIKRRRRRSGVLLGRCRCEARSFTSRAVVGNLESPLGGSDSRCCASWGGPRLPCSHRGGGLTQASSRVLYLCSTLCLLNLRLSCRFELLGGRGFLGRQCTLLVAQGVGLETNFNVARCISLAPNHRFGVSLCSGA